MAFKFYWCAVDFNVVLVSGAQPSDLVIHMHIFKMTSF